MTAETAHRYENDLLLWTKEQAERLREAGRSGVNLPLDWENLAEEVEGLGRSERRELRSRLDTIVEHLLKLEHSRADRPRSGWAETVDRERRAVEAVLADNPSLRPEVASILAKLYPAVAAVVAARLAERGEVDEDVRERMARSPYDEAQVLGDWFPSPPDRP